MRNGALASELLYPARRAPRRFLLFRAARERCGACLGVPAARRGSARLFLARHGSAWREAGPGVLALAARALLHWLSGRLRRVRTW